MQNFYQEVLISGNLLYRLSVVSEAYASGCLSFVLSMLFKLFGFLYLNLGLFAAGATLSFEKISDSPVDGLKSLKFLFPSLQISHVIRQLRYHSDRRPPRRPQGLKIYHHSMFNLTSKLFLLLFLRNHPFIGLQGPSKHQGLDLRERIKYR